jgi:hypothetical protein
MSVFQISRIQHRQGPSSELPDALADGEIGMTTDTGEAFFGAENHPSVANRTSYPYKNIKLLTEFDVQRGILGDVYYHGPLIGARSSRSVSTPVSMVPLFKHGTRQFANYDFGLSNADGSVKIIGELKVAVHPTDPNQSSVVTTPLTQCAKLNWVSEIDGHFTLSRTDDTGSDSGVTWLKFKNDFGVDLILSVSGREWSSPAV